MSSVILGLGVLTIGSGCSVYDESLLEPTGSGGSTSSTTTTTDTTTTSAGGAGVGGQGTGGGTTGCETPNECPGTDSECGTRTCTNHVCGVDPAPNGTAVASQTPGDCSKNVCDGAGDVTTQNDDTDTENDSKECTVDACSLGSPTHTPKNPGVACGTGGLKVCTDTGACVDCLDGSDCTSLVCDTSTNTCAAASCADSTQNGTETDLNCGGSCPPCGNGKMCSINADCASNKCQTTCQPSCTDGIKNQNETDLDCGGMCSACGLGLSCSSSSDCATGNCAGTSCGVVNLLISEARSRGPMGGGDDFVELYNPGTVPVTLTSDVVLQTRNKDGATYNTKWTGAGQVVPAKHHFLIAGGAYSGAAAADASFSASVTDEPSILLKQGAVVVDALCYHCGGDFPTGMGFICEGTSLTLTACATNNSDRSFERKPGGAGGNATDMNDNATDFSLITPSKPQNLASPATP